MLMRLAVVTISDRCSLGQMTDTAGPAAAALLKQQWPDAVVDVALLPDDEDAITGLLEQFASEGAALVLTVGGTGFGPRDRTPEATRCVLDREAPGLAEAMRANGVGHTPYAWLSRGVAGLKGSTVIVNLPGSKRAAEQSLASILPLLKHALEVVAGGQEHP
ncbi:MAG TPA: MogA/MoaB family molybdenum cofactor biosynthesis protein [Terracidiphilus sp.]|jgi:molybdopterin adenylyltransferase